MTWIPLALGVGFLMGAGFGRWLTLWQISRDEEERIRRRRQNAGRLHD